MATNSPHAVRPVIGSVVTAAIDFGTACSGYAFAFRHEPLKIYTNAWRSDGAALTTTKAPTVVLFDANRRFIAFGFDAQERYSDLVDEDQSEGYYYFEYFKMELYQQENGLTRETTLKDVEGKEMNAMRVFSEAIKYMKQQLLADVRSTVTGLQNDDILWILTVPAIWSEPAKQFMREAANMAGIDNVRLRLVLEPEAASIYCQSNCTVRVVQAGGIVELKPFPVDHTYIVVDLGGGTADIATHQVLHGGQLRELFRVTGGASGACRINQKFIMMMNEVFGESVINDFRNTARSDYLEMMTDFEMKKKRVKAGGEEGMRVKFPGTLSECVQKHHELSTKDYLNGNGYSNLIVSLRGKIQLSPNMIDLLFRDPVNEVVEKVREILRDQSVKINSLLLVGGFADSLYLRQKIQEGIASEFPDIDIVKPEEACLHVLKGAVLTTVMQSTITERISPFAYGLRTSVPFDELKHPANLREMRRSGSFCSDLFEQVIKKGQILRTGESIKHRFEEKTHDDSKYESRSIELFRSEKPDVKYTTDKGCERVAKIVLEPPQDEGWSSYSVVDITIQIGETELHIDAIDGTTGKIMAASVDFLGN